MSDEEKCSEKVCEHCGGTGYINVGLSYGDPNYGDPDYLGEPCPYCNKANIIETVPKKWYEEEGCLGCGLFIVGVLILFGVIISVIMWFLK